MTTNARTVGIGPAPGRLKSAATKAPPAKGPRKKPMMAISPTASATPAIVHQTHMSELRLADVHQGPGEVVSVERAQVLERLADADQLHGDAELARDGERDAALRRAVELGQDDAVDRHGLGEELRLAQAVLTGRGVDGEQRLVGR